MGWRNQNGDALGNIQDSVSTDVFRKLGQLNSTEMGICVALIFDHYDFLHQRHIKCCMLCLNWWMEKHSSRFDLNKIQSSHLKFRDNVYSAVFTCRLLSGSIFITGPMVLSGRLTSMLWLGLRGVRTCRGPAGARPKLKRNKMKEMLTKTILWQKSKQLIDITRSYLFLLNWMAKSVMTLIALLVRVISIWMVPARRAKVPDISSPLPFMAGSQTCQKIDDRQVIYATIEV